MLISTLVWVAYDRDRCTLSGSIEVATDRALTLVLLEEHTGGRCLLHLGMLLTELL